MSQVKPPPTAPPPMASSSSGCSGHRGPPRPSLLRTAAAWRSCPPPSRADLRDETRDERVLRLSALYGQRPQGSGEPFTGRASRVVQPESRSIGTERLVQGAQVVRRDLPSR